MTPAGADPPRPLVVGTLNLPPISALQARAGGTEATLTFTTADLPSNTWFVGR